MCEPISIAAAGIGIAGTMFSMNAQEEEAKRQKEKEFINSQLMEEEARYAKKDAELAEFYAQDAERRGDYAADDVRTQGRRIISTQRALGGASGIALESESVQAIHVQTRMYAEVEAQTVRNNAAREAFGYRKQAEGFLHKEKMLRSGAEWALGDSRAASDRMGNARIGGLLTAGGQALGGLGTAYGRSQTSAPSGRKGEGGYG